MALLRKKNNLANERPSLLITLRLVDRDGEILDEQVAWQALVDCFKNHPTLDVFQAKVFPDKD